MQFRHGRHWDRFSLLKFPKKAFSWASKDCLQIRLVRCHARRVRDKVDIKSGSKGGHPVGHLRVSIVPASPHPAPPDSARKMVGCPGKPDSGKEPLINLVGVGWGFPWFPCPCRQAKSPSFVAPGHGGYGIARFLFPTCETTSLLSGSLSPIECC